MILQGVSNRPGIIPINTWIKSTERAEVLFRNSGLIWFYTQSETRKAKGGQNIYTQESVK